MSARDDYPYLLKVESLPLSELMRAEITAALHEIDHLRRWKEEATEVIARWDECAKLVPVQLGEYKSDAVKTVLMLLLRDRGL